MKYISRTLLLLLTIFLWLFLFASQAVAAGPLAKVSKLEGKVFILVRSTLELIEVTRVGEAVNRWDVIQTVNGKVEITFNDGAMLNIRPFTVVMIQEREEKSLISKAKETIRRITCFAGALWFKTGKSKVKSNLQTPTVVCGIRGSEIKIGYDSKAAKTFAYEKVGSIEEFGEVVKGYFEDLGLDSALTSSVWDKFEYVKDKCMKKRKISDPLRDAECLEAALIAFRECIQTLLGNKNLPDDVRDDLEKELEKIEDDLEKIKDEIEKQKKLEDQKKDTKDEEETEKKATSPYE